MSEFRSGVIIIGLVGAGTFASLLLIDPGFTWRAFGTYVAGVIMGYTSGYLFLGKKRESQDPELPQGPDS